MSKDVFKIVKVVILVFLCSLVESSLALTIDFSKYNSSFMILVTKKDKKTYVCSSVAVAPKKILTAAHCLENAKSVKVVKQYKLLKHNSFYPVKGFSTYELYSKKKSNYLNDFGLITLKRRLPTNIKIPAMKNLEGEKSELLRVGFGMRNGVNARTVISAIHQYKNHKTFIDAYDQYSYSGDSGGPIFLEENEHLFLIGIHSTKEGYNSLNPIITDDVLKWLSSY